MLLVFGRKYSLDSKPIHLCMFLFLFMVDMFQEEKVLICFNEMYHMNIKKVRLNFLLCNMYVIVALDIINLNLNYVCFILGKISHPLCLSDSPSTAR